ncbi:MAG: sigma-54-dependent Fis family transcriptional regulator [Xanthomonadales bacterium]|nr:sigma-54-dependent Fis family transcriptional regulator [Xanthomonadales bacterium]
MPTVLVIDDNSQVCTALEVLLQLHDFEVQLAGSPDEGLAVLDEHDIDLVIQDMNFTADTTSGEEGVALFNAIREIEPDMPVILLTAWTDLATAVDLVRAGAADYLGKPWDDRKLVTTVRNLTELGRSRREASATQRARQRQRSALRDRYDLRGIVFASESMERLVSTACQVARADVPILITGPNGAGKERIAEIVQVNSSVREGPFITVNCGALPQDLIEAELFGAEAGAYTGANKAREGRFEAADGGTLFLDEIGNLPLGGQMKLLRVLETGQFERLGSTRTRQVKVRVVSATNADLPAMIREGRFREDLYYRLNLIELSLPPLAERIEDVEPLAEHFVAGRARLDDSAFAAMRAHLWPGNIRELKNAVERAVLLCRDGRISADDLGLPRPAPATRRSVAVPVVERDTIEEALQRHDGVISAAAAELGLSRQALYRRMEKLGIEADSAR